MKPESIDFIAIPTRGNRQRQLFLLVSIIALLLAWDRYTDLANQLEGLKLKVSELQLVKSHPLPQKQTVFVSENAALKKVLEALNMPWNDFFNHLEKSVTKQVAILAINPDPTKSTMIIEGVAKNTEALITLVDKINQSPIFEQAYIKSQKLEGKNPEGDEVGNVKQSLMPLHFIISASWRSE